MRILTESTSSRNAQYRRPEGVSAAIPRIPSQTVHLYVTVYGSDL